VDLKDVYFTIPIYQDYQKYLRFITDGTCYQFTCLSFSLSCALKPVMTLLRSWIIRIIIYIIDMADWRPRGGHTKHGSDCTPPGRTA